MTSRPLFPCRWTKSCENKNKNYLYFLYSINFFSFCVHDFIFKQQLRELFYIFYLKINVYRMPFFYLWSNSLFCSALTLNALTDIRSWKLIFVVQVSWRIISLYFQSNSVTKSILCNHNNLFYWFNHQTNYSIVLAFVIRVNVGNNINTVFSMSSCIFLIISSISADLSSQA